MKKILSIITLLIAFSINASAYDFMVDGICYNINEDGKSVEVTYERSDFYTNNYSNLSGKIVIPEKVVNNGKSYSVTMIGDFAFYGCTGLTGELTIPNSVTRIGWGAFDGCTGMTSMKIPNSVIEIGAGAFRDTPWYNSQPDGLVYVGRIAYRYKGEMSDGTSIEIKKDCIGISPAAFSNCIGLISVTIPSSVTSIGDKAFLGCTSLTTVDFPNSVKKIGQDAFQFCNSLTSINIPNSVIEIGGGAFYGCTGLTSINIPNSVTEIGEDAFWDTPWYNSQPDGIVYAGKVAYRYKGEMPEGTSIEIKKDCIGISPEAFSNCTGLTSVTIPNSVARIGREAFKGCTGLTGDLTIPNSVTMIGSWAFSGCTGLTGKLTISNSVTTIGSWAFDGCTGLTGKLTIPNSVTTIGSWAFSDCTGLTGELIIPDSVTSIGSGAFANCTGLASVTIPNSVSSIGEFAFSGCTGLTGELTIPNSVTTIGERAFYECSGMTSVTIPNSVARIGREAFKGCTGLTGELIIPDSVTTIGESAFSGCTGLTSVTIPNSVLEIGSAAFSGCTGLTGELTIPNSVTTIGDFTFYNCTGLTSVTIPNSVSSIGEFAFSGCTGLKSIYSKIRNPQNVIYPSGDYIVSVFSDVEKNICTLYIPKGTLKIYKQLSTWRFFTNKTEIKYDDDDIYNHQIVTDYNQNFATQKQESIQDNEDYILINPQIIFLYDYPTKDDRFKKLYLDFQQTKKECDDYYNQEEYDKCIKECSNAIDIYYKYMNDDSKFDNILVLNPNIKEFYKFQIAVMLELKGRCYFADNTNNNLDSALYNFTQAETYINYINNDVIIDILYIWSFLKPFNIYDIFILKTQLKEDIALCYMSNKDYNSAYDFIKIALNDKFIRTLAYFKENTAINRMKYWEKESYLFQTIYPAIILGAYKQNGNTIVDGDMTRVLYDKSALFSKGLLLTSETELSRIVDESDNPILKESYNDWKSDDNLKNDNEAEKAWMSISEEYGDFRDNLKITWDSVQAKIDTNDIAIEFLSFPKFGTDSTMYIALTVRQGYDYPHLIELCEERDLLAAAKQPYTSTALSDIIWGKLYRAGELNDVKNIFFSPCGELHKIGIESMPHWDGSGRLMSESGLNIYRLSSTRELALNRTPIESTGAAVFGGIYYKGDTTKLGARYKGHEGLYATRGFDFGDVDLRGISSTDFLSASLDEVKSIKALFENRKDSVYYKTEFDATEASFKALEGQKKRIIHIATHGFFLTDSAARAEKQKGNVQFLTDDAMTHSGLLFAAAANTVKDHKKISDSWEDGVLTAYEVSQLNLRGLDLVVLSACQTGNGEISGEGVFGMQRGFKMAGAQSIIMSLWDVDDEATKDMMTKFYSYWLEGDGMSKREAFLKAQQDVRNKDQDNKYSYSYVDKDNNKESCSSTSQEYEKRRKYEELRNTRPHWAAFILLDAME